MAEAHTSEAHIQKESDMGNVDKAKNATQKISGKAKETAGRATGNQRMEDEGRVDQTKAGAKQRGEKAKDVFRK